ncbi:MAG TPA: hypothetical protein VFN67_14500, partial [Polyangiales bacterium]|nr:hypothetical protein [Polyangiales bacterium]
ITFWGLFGRYPALPRVWQIGLAGGAVCAALVPWLTRSRALHGLCMVIATVFVAMTFGIKQLEPLVPALNFRARYFDPLVPLLALAIAACVRAGWRMYLQRKGKPANTMRERAVPRQVLAVACAALVCEVAVLTAIHGGVTGPQQLARNAEQARTLSEAYLAGTAIVANNAREHDQVKTLTVIAFAFLSDEAFWSQASPLKPRVMRVTVGRRSHRLMVRAPRETERLVRDIAKKRCAVFAARVSAKQGLKVQRGETSGCPSAL